MLTQTACQACMALRQSVPYFVAQEGQPYIETPCKSEKACQSYQDQVSDVPEEVLQNTPLKKQD